MSETFNKFQSVYRRILRFQKIGVLASWDLYTATPKLGFDDMSDTMTFASSEAFALSNSDEFFGLVEALNEPRICTAYYRYAVYDTEIKDGA